MNIYFGSMSSPSQPGPFSHGRGAKALNNCFNWGHGRPPPSFGSSSTHHPTEPEEPHQQTPMQVTLQRQSSDHPWGFRVQGGSDYKLQLTVCKTQSGSPSEGVLHRGDAIMAINGHNSRSLSHEDATEKIRSSGKELQMTICRRGNEDLSDLRPKGQLKFTASQQGKH